MAKSASLSAELVIKKGEALPATFNETPKAKSIEMDAPTAVLDRGYYKALTVKLDRNRYEALKSIGLKLDKKSQEIFVEALDLWMRSINDKC